MNNMGRCQYYAKRGQRLLRCQSPARQSVYLEGETLLLCPTHAALVMRLLAQKEKARKHYEEVARLIAEEERKILEAWREGQQ